MFTKITIVVSLISCAWCQAAVPVRPPFPDNTTSQFLDTCLAAHNAKRALSVDTPPLVMDPDIVAYAQSRCQLDSTFLKLGNGHNGLAEGYGENIYWSESFPNPFVADCAAAIQSWYNEINYPYPFGGSEQAQASSPTGHFTQIVWASTTRVGCATCGGSYQGWYENYVVCDYQPPGNYYGQYTANVHPLISQG